MPPAPAQDPTQTEPAGDDGPACLARAILAPPGGGWPERLLAPTSPDAVAFRRELGLPTDAPVVMSGHQATLWHPGIAAKVFAGDAIADRLSAAVAWLVIDLDAIDPGAIDAPVRTHPGRLERGAIRLTRAPASGAVPARRAPIDPDAPVSLGDNEGNDPVLAPIRERLERARGALRRSAQGATSASEQLGRAALALLPRTHDGRTAIVTNSTLASTALFAELLDAVRADPDGVRASYNDAVARHPDAGVRTLRSATARGPELPLWKIDEHGRRHAAGVDDLDADTPGTLAPRGMLTTAMMRLAGCELFLHGTGGRAYEPVNDVWLGGWDGARPIVGRVLGDRAPAPFAVASGDLLLDLGGPPATEADVARASWRAQHARHHPGLLGDDRAQAARDALITRISAAAPRSAERARLFRELHERLGRARTANGAALAALDREADTVRAAAAEHDLRADRTWSIALHASERLAALRDAMGREVGRQLPAPAATSGAES